MVMPLSMKAIVCAVFTAALATSSSAEAASFNCRYAKAPIEILICKDSELSRGRLSKCHNLLLNPGHAFRRSPEALRSE